MMRGQIVAADNGTPIRRAQVRISSPDARESRVAATDAQGRFEIKELPAGRYTVTASKGGFVSLQYGQRRPSESGTPIELGDGQTLDKLMIALPRGSVLGGRITDEFGEPVANASVIAMRYSYAAGGRRLTAASGSNSRDTTDDQGHYRLFGLPPGEYFVSATLRSGGPEAADPTGEVSGYAATYFPGTPNISRGGARHARGVAGEHRRVVRTDCHQAGAPLGPGADVVGHAGRGRQRACCMPGGAAGGRGILMQQGGSGGRIDQTGAFTIANVAPGRYQVQARSGGGRGGDGELAKMDLAVGAEDVTGLTMVTAPGRGGHRQRRERHRRAVRLPGAATAGRRARGQPRRRRARRRRRRPRRHQLDLRTARPHRRPPVPRRRAAGLDPEVGEPQRPGHHRRAHGVCRRASRSPACRSC